jgi:predicted phage tail protein
MKITKRQLRRIIAEEFRSREGKRLTRARYDELTDELDELYARLEKAKTMQEPNRSAHLQFYQNAINSLQGYLAFARAEGLSESRTTRITKQRLRKIVKEERSRLLSENLDPMAFSDAVSEINGFVRSIDRDDELPSAQEATEFASDQLYNVLSKIRSSMGYALEEAGADFFDALDMAVDELKEFGS